MSNRMGRNPFKKSPVELPPIQEKQPARHCSSSQALYDLAIYALVELPAKSFILGLKTVLIVKNLIRA